MSCTRERRRRVSELRPLHTTADTSSSRHRSSSSGRRRHYSPSDTATRNRRRPTNDHRPAGDVYLIYGRRATRFIETLYSNIGQTFVLVVASSLLAAAAAAVAEAAGRYARVNSDALRARSAGQLVSAVYRRPTRVYIC